MHMWWVAGLIRWLAGLAIKRGARGLNHGRLLGIPWLGNRVHWTRNSCLKSSSAHFLDLSFSAVLLSFSAVLNDKLVITTTRFV